MNISRRKLKNRKNIKLYYNNKIDDMKKEYRILNGEQSDKNKDEETNIVANEGDVTII